ncbi:hypothetical protein [Streptosporangium amethystogenes]|uniref:hypothetical protein n=1 Tax=Streptosporangium amethystogenes TaxID=2002 RepID=UPI0004C77383|nr:hypothetical protein [Streptosporangium amethystogenes]
MHGEVPHDRVDRATTEEQVKTVVSVETTQESAAGAASLGEEVVPSSPCTDVGEWVVTSGDEHELTTGVAVDFALATQDVAAAIVWLVISSFTPTR